MSGLYVVAVRERIHADLAGHGCRDYTSPPQPRHQALALAQLLLGATTPPSTPEGTGRWTRAVAGGQRTVTVMPSAPPCGQPTDQPSTTT